MNSINTVNELKVLNSNKAKEDAKINSQFGLMDKTVNELILLWINTNRDIYIEFVKVIKNFIKNKNKLNIGDNLKNAYSKTRDIVYKNNRLFFFGIDIILVGIILYICKIGR